MAAKPDSGARKRMVKKLREKFKANATKKSPMGSWLTPAQQRKAQKIANKNKKKKGKRRAGGKGGSSGSGT